MKKKDLLFVLWLMVIWGNSSSTVSSGIGEYIYQFLHLSISFELFHAVIRKCAHFFEYALLGLLGVWCDRKQEHMILICFLAACIDETIQLFVNGRSGQISDVLLDFMGVFFGYLCYKLILRMMKH